MSNKLLSTIESGLLLTRVCRADPVNPVSFLILLGDDLQAQFFPSHTADEPTD